MTNNKQQTKIESLKNLIACMEDALKAQAIVTASLRKTNDAEKVKESIKEEGLLQFDIANAKKTLLALKEEAEKLQKEEKPEEKQDTDSAQVIELDEELIDMLDDIHNKETACPMWAVKKDGYSYALERKSDRFKKRTKPLEIREFTERQINELPADLAKHEARLFYEYLRINDLCNKLVYRIEKSYQALQEFRKMPMTADNIAFINSAADELENLYLDYGFGRNGENYAFKNSRGLSEKEQIRIMILFQFENLRKTGNENLFTIKDIIGDENYVKYETLVWDFSKHIQTRLNAKAVNTQHDIKQAKDKFNAIIDFLVNDDSTKTKVTSNNNDILAIKTVVNRFKVKRGRNAQIIITSDSLNEFKNKIECIIASKILNRTMKVEYIETAKMTETEKKIKEEKPEKTTKKEETADKPETADIENMPAEQDK